MQSIIKLSSVRILTVFIMAFCLMFSATKAFAQGVTTDDCLEKMKGSVVMKIGSPVAFNGNEIAAVDDVNHGIFPFVYDDYAYVPLRFVSENLNINVKWDENAKAVTINEKSIPIIAPMDTPIITVNGEDRTAKAAAQIYDGRVFVTIGELSKAIDYNAFYDYKSGLIVISKGDMTQTLVQNKSFTGALISAVTAIPTVGSKENLKKIISHSRKADYGMPFGPIGPTGPGGAIGAVGVVSAQGPAAPAGPTGRTDVKYSIVQDSRFMMDGKDGRDGKGDTSRGNSNDFSKTNVQVEGVDEADLVKTDGEYIYTVSGKRIAIARAYPASELQVVNMMDFASTSFIPQDLYINGDKLIIIGTENKGINLPATEGKYMGNTITVRIDFLLAYVYDISDKTAPKQLKEISIEGRNVTSRLIGNKVYLVAEKAVNDYYSYSYSYRQNADEWRPMYYDSAVSKDAMFIDYDKIGYLPEVVASSYIITAGIDLDKTTEEISLTTILGSASNVYASSDNMYIVSSRSYYAVPIVIRDTASSKVWTGRSWTPQVVVYKFSLANLSAKLVAAGAVDGTVLNQFSMDEYDEHFRIATTSTKSGSNTNNMFVLDKNMSIVGEITDIARGERIYSVRFMGKKAYMVTFRQIDPLFVLNMADPKNPFVEGELKIPGYSDYLHPYDDDHLIGFGRQTDGVQGIKISMFDVSDVKTPKELFNTVIPQANSELNSNHKALLFSKEKNIFAFPVSSYNFNGLYAYSIDLKKGFTLRGEVTHYDTLTSDHSKQIRRSLYIDDVLYTVSMAAIKANNLSNFKEIKLLKLN